MNRRTLVCRFRQPELSMRSANLVMRGHNHMGFCPAECFFFFFFFSICSSPIHVTEYMQTVVYICKRNNLCFLTQLQHKLLSLHTLSKVCTMRIKVILKSVLSPYSFMILLIRKDTYRYLLTSILPQFENEPRHEKTCLREFPTRSDSNRPAQLQKLAWGLKFWLLKLETIHYLGSEQQRRRSDCAHAQADLRVCCSHMA